LPTDKPADAPAAQRTAQPATRAEPHGAKRAASEHAQPETQRNAAHERAASASGARTAPRAADATTDDAKLPTMDELPASIRQQLPAMAVTVHAYSHAPADRLVGVNDRLLREGDTLAPGLELERITPDGMIFRYNGTRFRYRLP
jgi:general secretion pathway protein B